MDDIVPVVFCRELYTANTSCKEHNGSEPECIVDYLVSVPHYPDFQLFCQASPLFFVSAVQVFENTGKRRNCLGRAISPFPAVFSACLENFQLFISNLKVSLANSKSLKFVVGKGFKTLKGREGLKTLRKKEKLLVTSTFSFPHIVYSFADKFRNF